MTTGGTGERLGWASAITGAVAVTMVRPLAWALGLSGFLAGGGIVLVAWPILVLPTPTGLQTALGSPASLLVLGGLSAGFVALAIGMIAAVFIVVVAATLAGSWAERQGILLTLETAADEGLGLPLPVLSAPGAPGIGRVAIVRLLSLLPVVVMVMLAWQPVYDAAYRQLILPQDLVTPLPIRVMGDVPGWVIGIGLVWLLADAAAALGVRRLVLERRTVPAAWAMGWTDIVRRPHRVLPTAIVGILVLALLVGPPLAAATIGWERVREVLLGGGDVRVAAVAILVWVATWLATLVLAGVAAAVRSAAWTLEAARKVPVEDRPAPAPAPPSPG